MKNLFLLISFICFLATQSLMASADDKTPMDTMKIFLLDEVIVSTSSKETNNLRTLPGSVSMLSMQQISGRQVLSIKDISSFVPNLYIPDYGAKLTSAVYLRGIGARSSGQSIGLYVDHAPFLNKSAFDFELSDVQYIEILHGPQGTLYGRNAMGGVIHIHTLSPLDYQGGKASISYGNYGQLNVKASGFAKLSETIGIAACAYYDRNDGFFTNAYTGKKIDDEESVGGNLKFHWKLSPQLTARYTVSYEHTQQGAFSYGLYDEETGKTATVNINDASSYRRALLNQNLFVTYQNENVLLTSVTGYQFLDDDMKMDQDFSAYSMFVLNQLQKQHAFTEEITLKSLTDHPYQWSFGAFGFYDKLNTEGPVEFKQDGIDTILQKQVFDPLSLQLNQLGMPGKLIVTDKSLYIPGNFETPSFGAAIYHQSTYNNLFTEGLSITAGVRLDYEKQRMKYDAEAKMGLAMQMSPMAPPIDMGGMYPTSVIAENIAQQFWQVLPKIALKYERSPRTFYYFSVAKGYKSGGYNVQMSADVMQSLMQYDVMNAFKERIPANVLELFKPRSIKEVMSYQPEKSWNYELGMRSELIHQRLHAELTFFYMDVTDLQITKFVPGGSGRYLSNAGEADSYGVELSLRAILTDEFSADLNYGYTNATFRNYNNEIADFKGKTIPYTPQNTLSIGLQYHKLLRHCWIDQIFASAQCNGTGKIYWTETNDITQPLYAVVNAQAGIRKGSVSFNLWARNLTNTDYSTFFFESFNNPFMQKGKPIQFGAKINVGF